MARHRFYLEVDPFPVGRVDACFVPTPALRERLAKILHAVREGAGPICIAAPPGAGKTTLLEQVLGELAPQGPAVRLSDASWPDHEAFVSAIGEAFGLPLDRDDALHRVLARLDARLDASRGRDGTALIAIDDAEARDAQARAWIDALLATPHSPRLRFIVTRETTREDAIARGAPLTLFDIPPLTRSESDDYVHTRLCAAGLRGDGPFTEEMLRSIHGASGGRPGRIHRVATQMLANRRSARPQPRRLLSRMVAALMSPARRESA